MRGGVGEGTVSTAAASASTPTPGRKTLVGSCWAASATVLTSGMANRGAAVPESAAGAPSRPVTITVVSAEGTVVSTYEYTHGHPEGGNMWSYDIMTTRDLLDAPWGPGLGGVVIRRKPNILGGRILRGRRNRATPWNSLIDSGRGIVSEEGRMSPDGFWQGRHLRRCLKSFYRGPRCPL